MRNDDIYLYISMALLVVFPGLLTGVGILWWRGVRPRTLRSSVPVYSGAETHPLSIRTI